MFVGRWFLRGAGHDPEEADLDFSVSNIDVVGIPTGKWSTSLFSDYFTCRNLIPSCILSTCCPCVMFGQITVRAQIPLFIQLKNSVIKKTSGYGAFVDYFNISMIIIVSVILLLVLLSSSMDPYLAVFLGILVIACGGVFLFILGHQRTAFREKYDLPGVLPAGCAFWDMLIDIVIAVLCMPCNLSQMARHLFQYDTSDMKQGLFIGDPSRLPPLLPLSGSGQQQDVFQRPFMANAAGLSWLSNNPHPIHSTNNARQEREINIRREQEDTIIQSGRSGQSIPEAVAVPSTAPVYDANGKAVHH